MSKKSVDDITTSEELIAKAPINKYDPFQLKASIDDEMAHVSIIIISNIHSN